jgi:NDP-sugar pyrophosphorylase family protein
MKAIILAGGKGSRFSPITDTVPKALLPINENKVLIELILDMLPDKIDTIIISTKYLGNLIEERLGIKHGTKKILYAKQPQDQDGTWPPVYCAKDHINEGEVFCVFNCDDIFNKEELEKILENPIIGLGVTPTTLPAKYHGVRLSPDGYMNKLERHPNEDRQELVEDIFTNGFFILDSKIFDFPAVSLIDGEFGLPQTILAQKETYPLFVHTMNYWQPCNTFEDLEKITPIKKYL